MPRRRIKPKRRANHDGSLYFRQSDGRWVAVFDGRTKTHKLEARARQMWDEMKTQALAGYNHQAATSQLHTVATLAERMISPDHAPSTQAQYRAALEYLLPALGERSIQSLTTSDVNHWLASLSKAHGIKNARIRQVAYDLLKRACKRAIDEGLIVRSPIFNTARPKSRRKPMNPPNADDTAKILAETTGDRYHAAYALGLLAGLRPCEIFGLRWSRIDFRRKVLLIDHAAVVSTRLTIQDHSKTDAAYREVPMIPQLIAALKVRRQQAGKEKLENCEWVVPTKRGTPTQRTTFLSRAWKPMLARLGIACRSFYQARHSCVTLTIGAGVPLQVVAKLVGHADVRTTMSHYAHVLGGEALKAMDKLSKTIGTSTKHLLKELPRGDDSAR